MSGLEQPTNNGANAVHALPLAPPALLLRLLRLDPYTGKPSGLEIDSDLDDHSWTISGPELEPERECRRSELIRKVDMLSVAAAVVV